MTQPPALAHPFADTGMGGELVCETLVVNKGRRTAVRFARRSIGKLPYLGNRHWVVSIFDKL